MTRRRARHRPSGGARAAPSPVPAPDLASAAEVAPRWYVLFLCALVFAIYGRCLGHGFLSWDDTTHILDNPLIVPPDLGKLPDLWRAPIFNLYVPVAYSAWALLARASVALLGRVSPGAFVLANLALHAANAVLVLWLLRRLLGKGRGVASAALAGAALFAAHPLAVQAVAWISALRDLLGTTVLLGALHVWLGAFDGRRFAIRPARLGVLAALGALSLLCKPSAVALPALSFVLARLVLGTSTRTAIVSALPATVLALPAVIITRALQPTVEVGVDVALLLRPVIALDALAFYTGKLLLPIGLVADHGRSPAQVLGSGQATWTWLVPAVAAALAVGLRQKLPLAPAAALLFAFALAPVLGLVPFSYQSYSTVADHYAYLALFGPALLVAAALARWPARPLRWAAWAVVALLSAASLVQAGSWRDDLTLFSRVLVANPASYAAENNLGRALATAGRADEAMACYQRALVLRPGDPIALSNIGETLLGRGQVALADQHYARVLQERVPAGNNGPVFSKMRTNHAAALFQLGRVAEAMDELDRALALDPKNPDAHHNRGAILLNTGRVREALPSLQRAVELAPTRPLFVENLAKARAALR